MTLLIFLLLILAIVTVVGHLNWVALAWIGRLIMFGRDDGKKDTEVIRLFDPHEAKLNDLAITERLVVEFYSDGKLREATYEELMKRLRAERAGFNTPDTPIPEKEIPRSIETPPSIVAPPLKTQPFAIVNQRVQTFMNAEPEPQYEAPAAP